MKDDGRLVVEPWITHERLDDQVMLINLETGAYFALEGVAADCWTAVVAGLGPGAVVDAVVGLYGGDRELVAKEVEVFLDDLFEESLVHRTDDAPAATDPASVLPTGSRAPYRAPRIEKHDDLEELLLLDPIHDVGPEGWPAVT